MATSNNAPGSSRPSILKALTLTQRLSAPFISTFIIIHLSAPVLVSLGGSSLSSQVMLLGREYYQTSVTEPLLVYGPLAAHISASVIKRLWLRWPQRPSLLALSAYPLLVFLPIHVLTHRLHPSIEVPPILSLSPSELDYEYVKYGLRTWPIRNTVLYAGLVICGVTHGMEGSMLLWRAWTRNSGRRWTNWQKWCIVTSTGTAVFVGLITLGQEPLSISKSLMARFHAAWTRSLVYKL